MNRALRAILMLCLCAPITAQDRPPTETLLALTHVTVIDVTAGRALSDQTVTIVNTRIASVGESRTVRLPQGAREIDGRGKFLIPGLIDTHIHLATNADRERLPAVGPLLAHGVTGVRDAGAGGQDAWLVALRGRVARGEILAPRVYVSGMVSGRSLARSALKDASAFARQLIDLGVDGLKIRDGLTRDDIRAVIEAGAAARLPVYGHTYDATSRERDEIYTRDAVGLGVTGTMHVMGMPQLQEGKRPAPPAGPRFGENWQTWWVYYASLWRHTDPAAERELIEAMLARGVWLEPTLITEDWVVNADAYRQTWRERRLPGAFELMHQGFPVLSGAAAREYSEAFARMKDFVRRFHEAGGVVTAGTDCLPACGYGLQDELRLLASAGLSPAAVLRAATVHAARVLGWDDRLGRVAPNFLADLVLLDANPLADIGHTARVSAVVANGRYLDRKTLDGLGTSAAPNGNGSKP